MRWTAHRSLFAVALPGLLLASGCEPPGKGAPPEMTDSEDGGDDIGATSVVEPDDTDSDGDGTSTTGMDPDDTDDEDGGSTFIIPPDDIPPGCDVWSQDCPEGEKCVPYSNNGDNSWNALMCAEVPENPGQPGDPCEVEGGGVTGIDTCDKGSMCWDVDGETNTGTCVAMCTGDQSNPMCDDAGTSCVIANDGVLVLCLPGCDPLLQDCGPGSACYPVNGAFTCAPDASGPELGLFGDPCEAINVCDPGLFCASAEVVPGCEGSLGCCSSFCDLSVADPSDACTGSLEGQECLPWFAEGDVPPGGENIGACAIPSS